jgi:hypothetical protein
MVDAMEASGGGAEERAATAAVRRREAAHAGGRGRGSGAPRALKAGQTAHRCWRSWTLRSPRASAGRSRSRARWRASGRGAGCPGRACSAAQGRPGGCVGREGEPSELGPCGKPTTNAVIRAAVKRGRSTARGQTRPPHLHEAEHDLVLRHERALAAADHVREVARVSVLHHDVDVHLGALGADKDGSGWSQPSQTARETTRRTVCRSTARRAARRTSSLKQSW